MASALWTSRGPEAVVTETYQAAAAAGRIGHVNDGVARPVEAVPRSDCYCLAGAGRLPVITPRTRLGDAVLMRATLLVGRNARRACRQAPTSRTCPGKAEVRRPRAKWCSHRLALLGAGLLEAGKLDLAEVDPARALGLVVAMRTSPR